MQQTDLTVNKLPAPTWNRLKLNSSVLTLAGLPDGVCEPLVALQGSVCLNYGRASCNYSCRAAETDFAAIPTGMGSDMERLGSGNAMRLTAGSGKSTAGITLSYKDGLSAYNRLEIEAARGSDLTVVMTYIANSTAGGLAAVQTKVDAQKGAKVKLVQVQLLGNGFTHLNDVGADLGENASFELIQLQLGAREIYNGADTELKGDGSYFNAAIGYYGRQAQNLDMNFVANHYGRKTNCLMTADGVLKEGARKLYRGTIDFKPGCAGAVGEEDETVLLLSDDVVNRTVPLILCSEEDVQGNHGASIGRLDENLLFYLMSRGFSEQQAVDMMARSKIDAISRRIDDKAAVELIDRYLEGVIADGE